MQRRVDDGGYSEAWAANMWSEHDSSDVKRLNVDESTENIPATELSQTPLLSSIYHSNNIFGRKELNYFNKRYRYGILNPYESLTNVREYVFFTKPDLQIFEQDENTGTIIGEPKLVPAIENDLYWYELYKKFPDVIACLQSSYHRPNNGFAGVSDPFNHLLENTLQTNIDVPGISAEAIETPVNTYGVGYKYHGSSEASDDNHTFSLEFKDTRYLPVYHFFKAYEDYQIKKHHGVVEPWVGYIENRILHDQYSIYKFLLDEDGETIVYYAKYYGVISKSLPRDVFSNTSFENGLSYSIDFECAFFEDMKPEILQDFNRLSYPLFKACPRLIEPYNQVFDRADTRPARAACVVREYQGEKSATIPLMLGKGKEDPKINLITGDMLSFDHLNDPGNFVYKLKWKGDDIY